MDLFDIAVASKLAGGGGGDGGASLTLLKTESFGTIDVSGTSAVDLQKSVVVENINEYDALFFFATADSKLNGHHLCSISGIWLHTNNNTDPGDYQKKVKSAANVSGRLNFHISNNNLVSNTNVQGVYPGTSITFSGDISNRTITIPVFARYSASYSSTIDDTYTITIYGAKFLDLI